MLQDKIYKLEETAQKYLAERNDIIHGFVLAVASGLNMLLLGEPGVAKTYVLQILSQLMIEPKEFFAWMLTKFSTPEEIYGPLSLKALEEDRFMRNIEGKLPTARLAFIDEIFKANSGILNSLLMILNERKFNNDGKTINVPLLTLICASNEIPEENDGLSAMYDRLTLKYVVKAIHEEANFKKMLEAPIFNEERMFSLEEIYQMRDEVQKIKLSDAAYEMFISIKHKLTKEGFKVTDRTYKLSLNILKAEAWYNKHEEVKNVDLEILEHVFWSDPDTKKKIYSAILDIVNPLKNKISELYDDAVSISDELLALPMKTPEDKTKRVSRGMEVMSKLKDIKSKLKKYKNELVAAERDTTEISSIEKKVDKIQQVVFKDQMSVQGIDE